MLDNPYFATARSWKAARAMLTFTPLEPKHTAGRRLEALRINVRDYKRRELPLGDRSLEAHYGAFSVSQARKGAAEARSLALEVSYGRSAREAQINGHAARVYELGPEPPPDDIDGRSPAVVTWADADMHYFIASYEMSPDALIKIAASMYR